MNGNFRNLAIWLVILFMLFGLFQVFQSSTRTVSTVKRTISQFVNDIDNGRIAEVTIINDTVQGSTNEGTRFEVTIPEGANIVERLENQNVEITARAPEGSPFWS